MQRAEKQAELMPTERGHLRLESCMRLPSSGWQGRILFRLQAQPVQRPRGRNVPTKSRQAQGTRMSRGERSRAEPRSCPSFWAWCLSDAGALLPGHGQTASPEQHPHQRPALVIRVSSLVWRSRVTSPTHRHVCANALHWVSPRLPRSRRWCPGSWLLQQRPRGQENRGALQTSGRGQGGLPIPLNPLPEPPGERGEEGGLAR